MVAFPGMLVNAATKAGIKIPEDTDNWEKSKDEFPHFFVFCVLQLGSSMPWAGVLFDNAKVIAGFDESEILTKTGQDILDAGFAVGVK